MAATITKSSDIGIGVDGLEGWLPGQKFPAGQYQFQLSGMGMSEDGNAAVFEMTVMQQLAGTEQVEPGRKLTSYQNITTPEGMQFYFGICKKLAPIVGYEAGQQVNSGRKTINLDFLHGGQMGTGVVFNAKVVERTYEKEVNGEVKTKTIADPDWGTIEVIQESSTMQQLRASNPQVSQAIPAPGAMAMSQRMQNTAQVQPQPQVQPQVQAQQPQATGVPAGIPAGIPAGMPAGLPTGMPQS